MPRPKGYTKYRWLINEIKLNPCRFVSLPELARELNIPIPSARLIVKRHLSEYFVVLGGVTISKCALERAMEELRYVVTLFAWNGRFCGRSDPIVEYVCGKYVHCCRRTLRALISITFPNAIVHRGKSHRKVSYSIKLNSLANTSHVTPTTLRKLLCPR